MSGCPRPTGFGRPRLLDCRAELFGPDTAGTLSITLPDGTAVRADDPDVDTIHSAALGRPVTLSSAPGGESRIEASWPAVPGLAYDGTSTEEVLPAGSYFDLAPLHVVTTASLERLAADRPVSRFEPLRFRPTVLVATDAGLDGFVEDGWVGRVLSVGKDVRLWVTAGCPR